MKMRDKINKEEVILNKEVQETVIPSEETVILSEETVILREETVILSESEGSSNCLTTQQTSSDGIYRSYFKRPMDFILALIAIIVLSPVLLIVALLVRIKLGTPVIFKQQRPGLNEKIFTLYKFRTMTDEKDEKGDLLPDSERLTDFGRTLRSTSLDELPELFNIVKGDMSIIGPRPLLVQYLPLYNEQQQRRHEVRPGLSGLAMAKGRNFLSWEEKFAYDVYYANNVSFLLDIKIVFWTLAIVFKSEGINEDGYATVSEFKGSNKETGVELK